MNGVLILDKPAGFTSFDVVAVLRGLTHEKKIGHTGTLDPMATGVLPLLLGNATRAAALLPDTDKEYEAGFRLGIATDTQDSTGKTLAESGKTAPGTEVENALGKFRGEILQLPPMVSAVSVNGRHLYDLARQGIEVEREKRAITVYKMELTEFDEASQTGRIGVSCSKGTYIRTLCADLGEALGTYGVMTSLRRTRASGFQISDTVTLGQAKELAAAGRLEERLLPVESLFGDLPEVTVTEKQAQRFANGGALDLAGTSLSGSAVGDLKVRVHGADGKFLGLGEVRADAPEKPELRVLRLFL